MGCGASTAAVAPADVVPPQPDAATDGASPLDLTEGEPVRDADDAAKWDFAFN